MSFESGAIGFRMFLAPRGLPDDALARLAGHAAPPLKTLGMDEIHGFVGGRHLLDLPVSETNGRYGGYLRLFLMKAERKIPAALFKAECMLEELALLQSENRAFLKRQEKSELRARVRDRLLPSMPPQLTGIPFVYDAPGRVIYAGALSEKQADALRLNLLRALGAEVYPLTAETAAAQRKVDVRDWPRASFSPEVQDADVNDSPGQDFLTWLWFHAEARGGLFKLPELGETGVALEGPLCFTMEGDGAHETVLRKGAPLVSAEAKTSLLGGKKLRSARLLVARGDESWSCAFDADTFVFRGLKLPDSKEQVDPVTRFQDRMQKLNAFRDIMLAVYDRFLAERSRPGPWSNLLPDIHAWVKGRKSRR